MWWFLTLWITSKVNHVGTHWNYVHYVLYSGLKMEPTICQGIPSEFPVLWCHKIKVHVRFHVKLCQNKRLFISPSCILLHYTANNPDSTLMLGLATIYIFLVLEPTQGHSVSWKVSSNRFLIDTVLYLQVSAMSSTAWQNQLKHLSVW